jgi:hypothetical protein
MTVADAWNIVAAAVLSIGGAAGLVVVLAKYFGERVAERWLEGVKAEHAKELARMEHELAQLNLHLQARLEHAVMVSRAQFETEFAALREVWAKMAKLQAHLNAMRPTYDVTPADKSQTIQKLNDRLNELVGAFNPAFEAVRSHSPFYPDDIQKEMKEALEAARSEIWEVKSDRKPFSTIDWFKDATENRDKFNEHMIVAAGLIRERLASLVIQER